MKQNSQPPQEVPVLRSLADLTAAIAPEVLKAVVEDHKRLSAAVSAARTGRDRLAHKDHAGIMPGLSALLRWWGWIEPLRLRRAEENLLLAWLLDATELSPMARVWASRVGRDPARLFLAGGAPGWTGRAEGLKRWQDGRPVNADPWRLFPAWLREELRVPPGDGTRQGAPARFPLRFTVKSAPLDGRSNGQRQAGME